MLMALLTHFIFIVEMCVLHLILQTVIHAQKKTPLMFLCGNVFEQKENWCGIWILLCEEVKICAWGDGKLMIQIWLLVVIYYCLHVCLPGLQRPSCGIALHIWLLIELLPHALCCAVVYYVMFRRHSHRFGWKFCRNLNSMELKIKIKMGR